MKLRTWNLLCLGVSLRCICRRLSLKTSVHSSEVFFEWTVFAAYLWLLEIHKWSTKCKKQTFNQNDSMVRLPYIKCLVSYTLFCSTYSQCLSPYTKYLTLCFSRATLFLSSAFSSRSSNWDIVSCIRSAS